MANDLNPQEYERYARHILLPEMGLAGQIKLKESSVACVGLGGLGSPAALYLAASGIGRLALIDDDTVDVSNLQRQILYKDSECGSPKVELAKKHLLELNPHIQIDVFQSRLDVNNSCETLKPYDIILDGSDNFPTRYLVNDTCVLLNKPLIHGSIYKFDGQLSIFATNEGPCYRCLCPQPPEGDAIPNCAQAGVIGVLPGIIGTLQATEAIKLILGLGTPLIGKILQYDALNLTFRTLSLKKNPDCPICSDKADKKLIPKDYQSATCFHDNQSDLINCEELAKELESNANVSLIDVRTVNENTCARIPHSKLICLDQLENELEQLRTSDNIIVYCQSGKRSLQGLKVLKNNGFANCKSLEGGLSKWSSNGHEILRGIEG